MPLNKRSLEVKVMPHQMTFMPHHTDFKKIATQIASFIYDVVFKTKTKVVFRSEGLKVKKSQNFTIT